MSRTPRASRFARARTALFLAIALGASAAVSTAQAVPLRWAAQNDVLTLDPHSQDHTTTTAILQHAYEGLTRYSEDWEIEPCLATKWTAISPTQVRFELRKGVKFHDGSPFTADDVIFSFNRIRQPQGTMQIYVTGIKEIRKIDDLHHRSDAGLAAADPAAQPDRLPDHEQGLVREEQGDADGRLQGQG